MKENIVDDLRVNSVQMFHAFNKVADGFNNVIILNIHNIDDGATFLDILDIFRGGVFKVVFSGEVIDVYGEEGKIFSGLLNFGGGVQHHCDLRAGTLKDDFENTSFAAFG